jgi:hypothetical protein
MIFPSSVYLGKLGDPMATAKKRKIASTPTTPTSSRSRSRSSQSKKLAGQSKKLAGKDLEVAVEQFQSEPYDQKAHEQWKRIERSVFGVQFDD